MRRTALWSVIFLSLAACSVISPAPPRGPEIRLYPAEGASIWGHQVLTLDFDPRDPPEVSQVLYTVGGTSVALMTPQHPLNQKTDRYEILLCAECLDAGEVSVTFEFAPSGPAPITRRYRIDHVPVLTIAPVPLGGDAVLLDASESYDPEGRPLKITWQYDGGVHVGATYRTTRSALREDSVYVRASDGVTFVDDFVYQTPSGIIRYEEKMACFGMDIVDGHHSLLVPRVTLGPTLAAGQKLPVDANGRTTRDFLLRHLFEVRGFLEDSVFVFEEGQDVARSSSVKASDPLATTDKIGSLRNESNRTELFGNPVSAPFGALPVWDNYDNHPRVGKIDINVPGGIREIDAVTKSKIKVGNVEMMIWLDGPGISIPRGSDVRGGLFYRGSFRAWMIPAIPACERFFTIEIEVDGSGTVTKNELKMQ